MAISFGGLRACYGDLWTVNKLKCLTLKETMALFRTLSPPEFSEMDGEYEAGLLDHGNLLKNHVSLCAMNLPLIHEHWLGKAFTPEGGNRGHGYNGFWVGGRAVRKYRMDTSITASRFDGRPSFQLVYDHYDSLCGRIHMVDEVRKLEEGLYLGVGTWGYIEPQRKIPLPFYLSGPVGPFVGADREERK